MGPRIAKLIALAASVAALLTFAACGDDESGDQTTGSEIEISVPDVETAGEQPQIKPEEVEALQPSKAEQERINQCIEQAQGDPNKIIDCTKIANE